MFEMKRDCKRIGYGLWLLIIIQLSAGFLIGFFAKSMTAINWLSILISIVSMVIAYIYLKKSCNLELKCTNHPFSKKIYLYSFLFILAINLLNGIFLNVMENVFNIYTDTSDILLSDNVWQNIAIYISALIIAPIFEELLFRGAILRILDRYNRFFAIFTSSFLFALLHMDVTQFFFTFFLGFLMAYLSLKYDSMKINIGIHFLNNAWAVLITVIYYYGSYDMISIVDGMISLLMIAGCIYCVYKGKQFLNSLNIASVSEDLIKYTFFNIPMILFWVLCIFSMISTMLFGY